jgi:hypothetical protein
MNAETRAEPKPARKTGRPRPLSSSDDRREAFMKVALRRP